MEFFANACSPHSAQINRLAGLTVDIVLAFGSAWLRLVLRQREVVLTIISSAP
jgi:hypothetical protein